ncbi:hypothetical protein COLO4_36464 [Corchorus olitorius]|uniref:Uncharacterized protein n=1 Tax=Corchorus olitorius TaxID=93759 RepID=A0A1R3G8Z8_9ROSI|nr:hypothetical protein COLO4_36464 [Corchorus olitorius]
MENTKSSGNAPTRTPVLGRLDIVHHLTIQGQPRYHVLSVDIRDDIHNQLDPSAAILGLDYLGSGELDCESFLSHQVWTGENVQCQFQESREGFPIYGFMGCGVYRGEVFLAGGLAPRKSSDADSRSSSVYTTEPCRSVLLYKPGLSLIDNAPMVAGKVEPFMFEWDEKLYALAGHPICRIEKTTFEYFDGSKWYPLPSPPFLDRESAKFTGLPAKSYVIFDDKLHCSSALSDLFCYDLVTKKWSESNLGLLAADRVSRGRLRETQFLNYVPPPEFKDASCSLIDCKDGTILVIASTVITPPDREKYMAINVTRLHLKIETPEKWPEDLSPEEMINAKLDTRFIHCALLHNERIVLELKTDKAENGFAGSLIGCHLSLYMLFMLNFGERCFVHGPASMQSRMYPHIKAEDC